MKKMFLILIVLLLLASNSYAFSWFNWNKNSHKNKFLDLYFFDKSSGKGIHIKTRELKDNLLDLELKRVHEVDRVRNQEKLDIFGTEYTAGQIATIWLVLLQGSSPVNNATCWVDVYRPDKSKLLHNAYMSFLENGIYYYDLNTYNFSDGVYMLNVFCRYRLNTDEWLVYNVSGEYDNIIYDNDIHDFDEKDDNVVELDYYDKKTYNTDLFISAGSVGLNSSISLDCFARKNRNYDSKIYVYNYRTGSWEYVNYIQRSNNQYLNCGGLIGENVSDYVNNGYLRFRIVSEKTRNWGTFKVFIDKFVVVNSYSTEIINNIRGGGEIHITNTNTTETEIYSQTVFDNYLHFFLLVAVISLIVNLGIGYRMVRG